MPVRRLEPRLRLVAQRQQPLLEDERLVEEDAGRGAHGAAQVVGRARAWAVDTHIRFWARRRGAAFVASYRQIFDASSCAASLGAARRPRKVVEPKRAAERLALAAGAGAAAFSVQSESSCFAVSGEIWLSQSSYVFQMFSSPPTGWTKAARNARRVTATVALDAGVPGATAACSLPMYSSQTAPALASAPTASKSSSYACCISCASAPFWPRYGELHSSRYGTVRKRPKSSSAGCSWPLRSSASIHCRHTPGDGGYVATHRSNTGRNTASRCDVSEQRAPRVGVVRVARHARLEVLEAVAHGRAQFCAWRSGERQSKIAAHIDAARGARRDLRFAGRGTIADAMVAIVGAVGDAAGELLRRMPCAEARCEDAVRACAPRAATRWRCGSWRRAVEAEPPRDSAAARRYVLWGAYASDLAPSVRRCKVRCRRTTPRLATGGRCRGARRGGVLLRRARRERRHAAPRPRADAAAAAPSRRTVRLRVKLSSSRTRTARRRGCAPSRHARLPWRADHCARLAAARYVRSNNVFYFTDRVYTTLRYLLACPDLAPDASFLFYDTDELLQVGRARLETEEVYAATRARVIVSAEARCMPERLGKQAWAHSDAAIRQSGVGSKATAKELHKWPRCLNTGNPSAACPRWSTSSTARACRAAAASASTRCTASTHARTRRTSSGSIRSRPS